MDTVREKSTGVLTGVLKDGTGAAIAQAQITSFALTIYEKDSETIINSRTSVDMYSSGTWPIVNGAKASVDASGNLTLYLAGDDSQIINSSGKNEIHVVFIEVGTGSTPPVALKDEFEYLVINNIKIT